MAEGPQTHTASCVAGSSGTVVTLLCLGGCANYKSTMMTHTVEKYRLSTDILCGEFTRIYGYFLQCIGLTVQLYASKKVSKLSKARGHVPIAE